MLKTTRKWKVVIDGRGTYRVITPSGSTLGQSFTLDRLDLVMREIRRRILTEQRFAETLNRIRAM